MDTQVLQDINRFISYSNQNIKDQFKLAPIIDRDSPKQRIQN